MIGPIPASRPTGTWLSSLSFESIAAAGSVDSLPRSSFRANRAHGKLPWHARIRMRANSGATPLRVRKNALASRSLNCKISAGTGQSSGLHGLADPCGRNNRPAIKEPAPRAPLPQRRRARTPALSTRLRCRQMPRLEPVADNGFPDWQAVLRPDPTNRSVGNQTGSAAPRRAARGPSGQTCRRRR